jgi:hypothetical protein
MGLREKQKRQENFGIGNPKVFKQGERQTKRSFVAYGYKQNSGS